MEGYINRLIDENDPIVRQLRREATFFCVPNMNPGTCTINNLIKFIV